MNPLEINELQKAMILRGVDYETSELIIQDFRARCVEFLGAERYHEIMQAEREGRLVILPCKVGDTLFMLKDGSIYDGTVRFLRWEHHKDRGVRSDVAANPNPYFSIGASFDDFGKTVFLSHSEAEKALEEANE